MLQPYRPSNHVPPLGLLWLALGVISVGIAFGVIAYLVAQFVWLIVLFPLGVGLACGALLAKLVTTQRVRHPTLVACCAVLLSVVLYATSHYAGYLAFQSEMRDHLASEQGITDEDEQAAALSFVFRASTGQDGFIGYLSLMAREGVSLHPFGVGGGGPVGAPIAWLLWLADIGITSAVAAVLAVAAARRPFCEACNGWFAGGLLVGSADHDQREQLLATIRAGEFRVLAAMLNPERDQLPSVDVYLQSCPRCHDAEVILSVSEAWLSNQNRRISKELLAVRIAAHHERELWAGG